jgi:hypothetical protein
MFPPQCQWDLRSIGISRNVEWYFVTDVSGHSVRTKTSVRNFVRCIKSRKSADLRQSPFSWSPAELHREYRPYLQAVQLFSFLDISNLAFVDPTKGCFRNNKLDDIDSSLRRSWLLKPIRDSLLWNTKLPFPPLLSLVNQLNSVMPSQPVCFASAFGF